MLVLGEAGDWIEPMVLEGQLPASKMSLTTLRLGNLKTQPKLKPEQLA